MPRRMILNGDGLTVYLRKPLCFDCAMILYSPPTMDSCYVRRGSQGRKGWWVIGYWCRYCHNFIKWEEWFILYEKGNISISFEYKKAYNFLDKEIYKLLLNDLRKKYGLRTL